MHTFDFIYIYRRWGQDFIIHGLAPMHVQLRSWHAHAQSLALLIITDAVSLTGEHLGWILSCAFHKLGITYLLFYKVVNCFAPKHCLKA
jgi:hypothetical protein